MWTRRTISLPERRAAELPGREDLMREVSAILGADVPQTQKALLHYLGSRVEAEVFVPRITAWMRYGWPTCDRRIRQALSGHAYFRAIAVNCRIAPR